MIDYLFGDLLHDDKTLTAFQIVARAVLVAVVALLCVRVTGRRAFGLKTPLDNVITFLLGATLSRAIVGDGGFVGIVAGSLTLACLHRLIAYVSCRSDGFRNFINGKSQILYEQGIFQDNNLKKSMVAPKELEGVVRKETNLDSLDLIQKATMEPSGEVSIVLKDSYSLPKRA
ncbi:DUF421 domain-containing protein [Fibrella sp. HMF5335]|uniref:DUF421 domain-containing protein n=1 Tax=Fibrella rubiginis TaxID=2817060 RepID=A0A939GF87_9BACT|nr:YetF domain-containing protein [Fibrella rubiginis]MBO0935700.1 DUF421 domain-containing protein [Fibrella rubiginis]